MIWGSILLGWVVFGHFLRLKKGVGKGCGVWKFLLLLKLSYPSLSLAPLQIPNQAFLSQNIFQIKSYPLSPLFSLHPTKTLQISSPKPHKTPLLTPFLTQILHPNLLTNLYVQFLTQIHSLSRFSPLNYSISLYKPFLLSNPLRTSQICLFFTA